MGKKRVDTVGPGSPEDEGTKSHAPHGPMRLSLSKRSRYEEFVAANGDGLVKLAYTICGDQEGRHQAAGSPEVSVQTQVTARGYDTMTGPGTPNGSAFINRLRSAK